MGVYFIAAGQVSQNRYKSLEKSFRVNDLTAYLPKHIINKLRNSFEQDDEIYVWGANDRSLNQLKQVKEDEYVVDIKNKEVMYVFRFCFYYRTSDTTLQSYIGWDKEKPIHERRPYHFVYFLKDRQVTTHKNKSHFGRAFGQKNPNWLVGQRYFNDNEVKKALGRTNSNKIEELLGVTNRFVKKDEPQKRKRNIAAAKKVDVYNQKSTTWESTQKTNVSRDSNEKMETVLDFHADKLDDYPASTRKPLTFWQWLKSLFGF